MKRTKTVHAPGSDTRPTSTGRDGAIDFALKMDSADTVELGTDHIYRIVELVGTSGKSIEDAIQSAITRANKTLRNMRWFEVVRTSGHVVDGMIYQFQVTLKVGFTMEDVS